MIEINPFSSKIWELQESIVIKGTDIWPKRDIDIAPKFRFDKIDEIPELFMDFGLDMLKRGKLQLPFERVIFEYDSGKNDEFSRHAFLCKQSSEMIAIMSLHRHPGKASWVSASKGPLLVRSEGGSLRWKKPEHVSDTYTEGMAKADIDVCVSSCIALSSSSFIQKRVIVPTHLQKARSRDDKPPLYEFKVVELSLTDTIRRPPIGSHASPMLHWRRGHYRRLSADNIVPVAPCLVGDAANGIVDKDYDARNLNKRFT